MHGCITEFYQHLPARRVFGVKSRECMDHLRKLADRLYISVNGMDQRKGVQLLKS